MAELILLSIDIGINALINGYDIEFVWSIFSFKCSRISLLVGLKWVSLHISTHFSTTDNKLLENLKERTNQTNSISYPFIDAFIPMYMVRRMISALSCLVLRCVLKLFLYIC
jgi:hypothetical protein